MIRTQIQFTEEQMEALRREASRRGRPVADLVRRSVDAFLARSAEISPAEKWRQSLAAVGGSRSELDDVSEEHDRHLAEAFAEISER